MKTVEKSYDRSLHLREGKIRSDILLACFLGLSFLVAGLLSGCGDNDIDPMSILSRGINAVRDADSMAVSMSTETKFDSGVDGIRPRIIDSTSIEGYIEMERDNMDLEVSMSGTDIGFLVIEGSYYVYLGDEWFITDMGSEEPLTDPEELSFVDHLQRAYDQSEIIEFIGEDVVDGKKCFHIRIEPDLGIMEGFENHMGDIAGGFEEFAKDIEAIREAMNKARMTIDVWADASDDYYRRINMRIEIDAADMGEDTEGVYSVNTEMKFKDFNRKRDLKPPESYRYFEIETYI